MLTRRHENASNTTENLRSTAVRSPRKQVTPQTWHYGKGKRNRDVGPAVRLSKHLHRSFTVALEAALPGYVDDERRIDLMVVDYRWWSSGTRSEPRKSLLARVSTVMPKGILGPVLVLGLVATKESPTLGGGADAAAATAFVEDGAMIQLLH